MNESDEDLAIDFWRIGMSMFHPGHFFDFATMDIWC